MPIAIRVKGKTNAEAWRTVTVSEAGEVACDCGGWDGTICSHVDAVLIANERGMVHSEDMALADQGAAWAAGKIAVPEGWKATWRREMWWRGISRKRAGVNPRKSGKWLVCFTGTAPDGRKRAAWKEEAEQNGWDVTDDPSPFVTVLVAADALGSSAKLKLARKRNTPIVSYEDWPAAMLDGVLG